jgi:hypothetical protein
MSSAAIGPHARVRRKRQHHHRRLRAGHLCGRPTAIGRPVHVDDAGRFCRRRACWRASAPTALVGGPSLAPRSGARCSGCGGAAWRQGDDRGWSGCVICAPLIKGKIFET